MYKTKPTQRLERPSTAKIEHVRGEQPPSFIPHGDDSPRDPFLNTLIDYRYEVQSIVAVGGMATVYRARDNRLDRPVALKIMHPYLAQSPNLVQRFRQEARAIARLSHPGIVNVYDQGVVGGAAYMVMEYVNGPNLRSVIRERGCFSVRESFTMIIQILQALAVAHEAGMIHRDVKPENVLITPSGRAKVADFGLARAVSEQTASTTGSVMGTVAYLAPELISAEQSDARTDIYSVGIMLYEMLAGFPPFHHDTAIQVAWSHVNEDVPALDKELPWVPSQISELICDLTARDPALRPANAHDALELVEGVYSQLPADILDKKADVAPFAGGQQQTVAPSSHMTTPAATARVTTEPHFDDGMMPMSNGTSAIPMIVEGDEKPADPKPTKRRKWPFIVALLVVLLGGAIVWWFMWGPGAYKTMINVEGKTKDQAIEMLKKEGLEAKIVYNWHDTVPKGQVIGTQPAKGKDVLKGSRVRVDISKGVHYVKVPNVVGQSFEAGQEKMSIQTLRLKNAKQEYSEDVPKGNIISIDPAAGKTVKHDTVVNAVVSKGREPVTVPELVGKSEAEAKKLLEDAGLKPAATYQISEDVPRGKVISHNPAANEQVFKNDSVTIVVSQGPAMVTVPNLFLANMSKAKAQLEGLGFKVAIEKRGHGVFPNVVYDQSVPGGTKARNGSTITLYYY